MSKLKILYAAGNNSNARWQLSRFLQFAKDQYQIKISAYQKSSPKNVSIDWTLDCLFNIYEPDVISLKNDNFQIYFEQIKYYAPDLIISDLEYFTSYIANVLNINILQCSSSLINFSITDQEKSNLGLGQHYAYIYKRHKSIDKQIINFLDNSDGNFVYSHFGDMQSPPKLKDGFNWIKPYHQIGKPSPTCQHHIVANLFNKDKQIFGWLQNYPDVVAFVDILGEKYSNISLKNIENNQEYFCNLKNSPLFVCRGQTTSLADAFYNGKYSLIYPDYDDVESVINSYLAQKWQLGYIVSLFENLDEFLTHKIVPTFNPNNKLLHEKIEELV